MQKPVIQIWQILLQLSFSSIGTSRCDGRYMTMVAQPLRKLPEPRKMDHILLALCTKNKMASVAVRAMVL
jgi:hypothetical protein